ncbi:MAG: sulfotransferase [Pseudomonadota bacterium]
MSDSAGRAVNTSAFPPRLIIIGAQKAGTTTLAHLLATHPDIAMGAVKEVDFYTRFWTKGWDWYRAQYEGVCAKWLIDASPAYAGGYDDPATGQLFDVPGRINEHAAGAHVFYILRCPVRRAYSSYWHGVRYNGETQPLRQAISPISHYARQSLYADQLKFFEDTLGAGQVQLLLFDDLKSDPQKLVEGVFSQIGAAAHSLPAQEEDSKKNAGFQYSGPAKALMKLFPSEAAFRDTLDGIRRLAPDSAISLAKRALTKNIPPLSDEDAQWLAAMFEASTAKIEQRLGRPLNSWIRPNL